jgi:hypothetical protein
LHILDRFHIVAKMNKALDEVRAAESRRMAQQGDEPLLKKSRWCVLKRKDNLTRSRSSACAICSATICKPSAPIYSRKTSSSSGNTIRPLGLACSWILVLPGHAQPH